jgi:release factor glutamine methyltransferase
VTILDCAAEAARLLTDAGRPADEARRDAGVLARHLLGWTLADWATRGREPAPDTLRDRLLALAVRRAAHEPVAYLTGTREFYGRAFRVTPDVLIPRPESEAIVDEALRLLAGPAEPAGPAGPVILDIGTGSGCLAITLALECPHARVFATDTSRVALEVARENARALGAGRDDLVTFLEASLAPPGLPPVDLIVSNPPYVPEADRASLAPDVRDYEPAAALFAGIDGLDVIRALLPAAARALAPGGRLVMEIGAGQAEPITALVEGAGLCLETIRPDLQDIPRIIIARLQAAA